MQTPPKGPLHVAIIMDGNGRWAKSKGLSRSEGHKKGVESLKNLIKNLHNTPIRYLTIYAFSSENWLRPKTEVNLLLNLLLEYLTSHTNDLIQNHIQLHTIGRIHEFPKKITQVIEKAKADTAHNNKYHLTIALNYGSQNEILDAVNRYIKKMAENDTPPPLTWPIFQQYLDTAHLPPLDLLIRTSGEYRLSNFLLMQAAYAELYISPLYWPEFTPEALKEAIAHYHTRERRYGMTSEQIL